MHALVPAAGCFVRSVKGMLPAAQRLDTALAALEEGDMTAENAMESALAEVEDLISYCNDILCTGAARAPDCWQCHMDCGCVRIDRGGGADGFYSK